MFTTSEQKKLFEAISQYTCRNGLDIPFEPEYVARLVGVTMTAQAQDSAVSDCIEKGLIRKFVYSDYVDGKGTYYSLTTTGAQLAARIFEGVSPEFEMDPPLAARNSKFVPILDIDDDFNELQNRVILELYRNPTTYSLDDENLDFTKLIYELDLDARHTQFTDILSNLENEHLLHIEGEEGGVTYGSLTPAGFQRGNLLNYIVNQGGNRKLDNSFDRQAPASDRIVSLSDNLPEVTTLRDCVEALDTRLREANALEELSNEERELFIVDMAAVKKIVNLKNASLTLLSGFVLQTFVKIGDRLSDAISSGIVGTAINALKSILGL